MLLEYGDDLVFLFNRCSLSKYDFFHLVYVEIVFFELFRCHENGLVIDKFDYFEFFGLVAQVSFERTLSLLVETVSWTECLHV